MRNSSKNTFPSITKQDTTKVTMPGQTQNVHLWASQQGNFLTKCTGRHSWEMVIRKFVKYVIIMQC